jgi:hypothetical protein
MAFQLDGYVDVAERIRVFKAAYPQGSLQPANPAEPYKLERIGDRLFIVVIAAAYRTPDDTRPGIGMAMEPYPGRTNYTKDSELMNAETSAWGRAIVAALAADTQKIASAQEVRNRQADQEAPARSVVNNTVNRDTLPNPRPRPVPESPESPSEAPESREEPAKPQRAKLGSAAASPTLSDPQRGKIRAIWRSLEADGNTPGDDLVKWCAEIAGRDITVINELTKQEASKVIEELIRRQA